MLFKQHDKYSPLNSTHCAKLYPQNGDRVVAIDSVTSFHPVYRQEKHSKNIGLHAGVVGIVNYQIKKGLLLSL